MIPARYRNNPGERLWPRLVKNGECMEWSGSTNEHGYGSLRVNKVLVKAHRFAYELTNGPIPPGMDVLHSCDNPPCCNPAHLSLGDAAQNAAEMVARGRHASVSGTDYLPHGVNHHSAKLTPESVDFIRRNPYGESVSALSRRFGVARATIRAARDEITWRAA